MTRVSLPGPYPRRAQAIAALLFAWLGIGCICGLPAVLIPETGLLGASIVVAAGTLLGVVLLSARVLRSACWLEGNTLVARGLIRTRRCDLSRAEVRLTSRNEDRAVDRGGTAAGRVPVLSAYDPGNRQRALVRLREPTGGLLDLDRLMLLANAISAADRRAEPQRANAAWVANGLRQLATNPLYHII